MVFKRLTGLTRIFQWLVLSPRIKSRVWIWPLRVFTLLPSCPLLTSVPTQLTAPSLRSIPAPADISHAPRLLLLVAEVPAQTQLCTWRLRRPPRQATFCVPRESCTCQSPVATLQPPHYPPLSTMDYKLPENRDLNSVSKGLTHHIWHWNFSIKS